MRQIFISEGNQIGADSNWLPGSHDSINDAAQRGMVEFDGNFTLWENDSEGNPTSIDIEMGKNGRFYEPTRFRRCLEDRLRKDRDFLRRVQNWMNPPEVSLPDTQFRRDRVIYAQPQHNQFLPEDIQFLRSQGWRTFCIEGGSPCQMGWYDVYPPLSQY